MKPLFCSLLIAVIFHIACSASVPVATFTVPEKKAKQSRQSGNLQGRITQMQTFTKLTARQYGELRGKKLNVLERFSFNVSKHRMEKMLKRYSYGDGPTTLEKIAWFGKGLLLGPIALLIGYLVFEEEERELIRWIWYGCIVFAAILIFVLLLI